MTIILDGTTGISTPGEAVAGNLSYTGTLTGNGGIVNIGAGQVYKDASGNVGIGTTAPSVRLNVSKDGAAGDAGQLVRITDTNTANAVGPTSLTIGMMNHYAGNPRMSIAGTTGLSFCVGDGSDFSAQRKVDIDSSGNLLVGTTSIATIGGVGSRFQAASNAATTFQWAGSFINTNATGSYALGVGIKYSASVPNSTAAEFLYCEDTSAVRLKILSNGGIANYSANNTNLSDRLEKMNFAPAGSYLDKICAIPVQTYNYIDQNLEEDDGLTLGVVAQDVQAVAPELVMESNWAGKDEEPKMRLSIYQTDLQYALMKCIQEQQTLITALTARTSALEERLTALEAANV